MATLLIASGNRGKLREIQAILGQVDRLSTLGLNLTLPEDVGIDLDVAETGSTYAENAAIKARAYTKASGMIVLADDSGLEVAALGGEPGLYSARYAPWPAANDADRRRYLLQKLAEKPQPWPARFHCTAAIATPAGELYYTTGNCAGEIIAEERGTGGFGYDPIFFVPQFGQTMAELPMEVKNTISHRALAVLAAVPILEQLFQAE